MQEEEYTNNSQTPLQNAQLLQGDFAFYGFWNNR